MTRPEQAVIFCGGLGTRLRPLTNSLPKPMVSVNGKPFLEHLLLQLSDQGLKRFFCFDDYRTYAGEPLQMHAVQAAVDNKSLLAIFPTGGGKSITFQVRP